MNWQQPDWPHFKYDLSHLQSELLTFANKTGLIAGKLEHLSQEVQTETIVNLLVEGAIKTSQIEGENINRVDVRSSIKNKLGLKPDHVRIHDQRARAIAELLLDVRETFKDPLTDLKLFDWHLMLLSGSMNSNLRVGRWRDDDEPMQIVAANKGKWTVYFEAPPAKKVPQEMEALIHWFNETAPGKSLVIPFPPVRAAIAHLYFESIHPFDDGNGRIGRAIAEKALSQGLGFPPLISLSQAIEKNKKDYYNALHAASKTNEITAWIDYFIKTILSAQTETEIQINFILKKTAFFNHYAPLLNERELKVIKNLFAAGTKGFEGGLSAKKYMNIAKTSKATATRDLHHLCMLGALKQFGSGRSVRYELQLN